MSYLTESLKIEILMMIGYGDRARTQCEVVRLFRETHPDLPPLNQGTISKIEAQYREMGHVRKVPSKRQAVVDDDTKLNLLLVLEENPITPARQLACDKEIIKSRNELKHSIEANEARLLLKIEAANNQIAALEKENRELKKRIEQIENLNRKKNRILFGLEEQTDIIPQFICQKLNSLLDIDLCESNISNLYPIGKSETPPIKVEFSSYSKKNLVIKNCHKLKGKNISIANDLSVKQREDNKL
ncbi:hypothetical protein NQ318_023408 [Aromia moschata]|uniref:DUF4817 domain-containing protein n=1 Tax=Aromia moschata TaxID=1265417 RepID=A0AAV8YW01_9CUCU|nr:hypothetical protein NQ318_023408 [Aromia moschata]